MSWSGLFGAYKPVQIPIRTVRGYLDSVAVLPCARAGKEKKNRRSNFLATAGKTLNDVITNYSSQSLYLDFYPMHTSGFCFKYPWHPLFSRCLGIISNCHTQSLK